MARVVGSGGLSGILGSPVLSSRHMTLRRVVALAQALTMILILAPGPHVVGPSSVRAAIAPAEAGPVRVYDATGRGIGCQAGVRKYNGPKPPKDPPWPPGAEPTPTPEPSPTPSPEPSLEPSPDPSAIGDTAASPSPDQGTATGAGSAMAFMAAPGVRVAQAEATAEPSPTPPTAAEPTLPSPPAATDADIAPDVETAAETKKRNSKLISGIDVSHHNGDIDYAKVREAGNRFVFIKATQDNDFTDPMFPTNLARARAAGLAAGAYHFFDYTLDGKAQADHFLDRVEAAGGIDDALPPVVDVECWAPIGSSIHAVSATRLRDFVQRIYERTGRMPLVYTSVFMWKQVVGNAEGFERLPLWAACWGCDAPPSLAPGWDEWTFWQTGVDRVPGVGRLDGNFFSGSNKDLDALKLRPLTIEGGDRATGSERVEMDLGGRDATHLRTSPDGETWTAWRRIRSAAVAELAADEGEQTVFVQLRNGSGLKSPVYRDAITLDRTGPEVSTPSATLREGPIGSGPASIPVSVSWEARDTHAGLSDASVTASCGKGRILRTEAPGSAAPDELASWDALVALVPDETCVVTAVSRDGVGNVTRATADAVRVAEAAAAGGAKLSATVQADQVGVVARRGPDAGRAAVLLDGEPIGLLDLYAPSPSGPEIVFVADLEDASLHSMTVEATETSDPASAGTGIVVDGFVTLTST